MSLFFLIYILPEMLRWEAWRVYNKNIIVTCFSDKGNFSVHFNKWGDLIESFNGLTSNNVI